MQSQTGARNHCLRASCSTLWIPRLPYVARPAALHSLPGLPPRRVFLLSGPRVDSTVYEMVVAHEENMSHETAMRVAKGGGIRKQTLVDMENVESLVRGPVVDRSMARRPTRAFAAVGKGPGSR